MAAFSLLVCPVSYRWRKSYLSRFLCAFVGYFTEIRF
jgi:hypothetical protein